MQLQAAGHRHNEVLVVAPSLQYDMLPIQETDPQEVVRLGFIGTLTPQQATPPEDAQVHAPLSYIFFQPWQSWHFGIAPTTKVYATDQWSQLAFVVISSPDKSCQQT